MTRRPKRSKLPHDPAALLRQLRAYRNAMIDVFRQVEIYGPVYKARGEVTAAIDRLAEVLTGRNDYFAAPSTTARAPDWKKVEAGEEPWPDDRRTP